MNDAIDINKISDYKELINKLIEEANELQLRQLYHFVKGFLG